MTFDRRMKVLAVLKKAFPEYPCFMGFDFIPELKACVQSKTPFIYADHAYFDRGYDVGNFRVILSGIHQTEHKKYDEPRFKFRLGEPKTGRHILVFPPSATISQTFDSGSWTEEIVRELRRHTDRPIAIKRKQDGDLNRFLVDCHAVVGYATVASVEAKLHGVPAFSGPWCPAMGPKDLSLIEKPELGDRVKWLAALTYSQFHLSEIENGFCREVLLGG